MSTLTFSEILRAAEQLSPAERSKLVARLTENQSSDSVTREKLLAEMERRKDAAVTELHDRIIAGVARRLDAPLIALAPIITSSGIAEIAW